MLKIEDILREDFDWENVEIDENEFVELEKQFEIILSLLRCGALDGITGTTSYYGG